jgi:hypothetical protein
MIPIVSSNNDEITFADGTVKVNVMGGESLSEIKSGYKEWGDTPLFRGIPQLRKIKSSLLIQKYDNSIADFLISEGDTLLKVAYITEQNRPPAFNWAKYRMLSPDIFNDNILKEFSCYQDVFSIVETKAKSHDWELFGKKISVKSMRKEIFPREKRNRVGLTKALPIQLKNTRNKLEILDGEFDYLLLIVTPNNPLNYGIYFLGFDQVKKWISITNNYNRKCDTHGYDGGGQVKLYLGSKLECLACIEMRSDLLQELESKYKNEMNPEQKTAIFLKKYYKLIESINMRVE